MGDKNTAKLQKNTHICKKNAKKFAYSKKKQYFCTRFRLRSIFFALSGGGRFSRLTGTPPGAIAQLVEQRTENPCVPSSILGGTTKKRLLRASFSLSFIFHLSFFIFHFSFFIFHLSLFILPSSPGRSGSRHRPSIPSSGRIPSTHRNPDRRD